jgi:hypothetical protein
LLIVACIGLGCRRVKLETSVIRSTFIFDGTVLQSRESLEKGFLPAAPDTHIVRVDRIYAGAADFAEFRGQRITVRILPGSHIGAENLRTGQSLLFLTTPMLVADSLAVEGEARDQRPETVVVVGQREELRLARRIDAAALIVSGSVVSVRPLRPDSDNPQVAAPQEPDPEEFEHDPVWYVATVSISSIGKGRPPGSTVDVLFPTSSDIVWFRSPRYAVKQSGTWLLQRPKAGPRDRPAFTALDPLDFQTGGKTPPRLEKLLRPPKYPAGDPDAKKEKK